MAGKLKKEIAKSGPFASLEEEVMLNLLRTADRLTGRFESALKPSGLTPTQYNVLRILRGVSPQGIACQEIARRMITRDADLTRLLDRLESRGLVHRQRQADDRRVVHATITGAGMSLLAELDGIAMETNKKALGHLGSERLRLLLELLEEARDPVESQENP
ncbi:MAG: MarR family transcriptional regulator [Tepidisphaeraceae bacterium]|jgi:DNA-binding MarR family transcriptional regulator